MPCDAEDTDGARASQTVTYKVVSGPPNTILRTHPKKTVKTERKKAKVKSSFSASVAGAKFKCKLDRRAFAPCTSPKTYKVGLGKHTFSVEALAGGKADPTPAKFGFKVKRRGR